MQHEDKDSGSSAWPEAGLKAFEARVRQALAGSGVEDIRIFETLPSTNTSLMQRPFTGQAQSPVLCWALHQTAGRGRRGRSWLAEGDQALTFSLAFETMIGADSTLSSLSPASGLALARALDPVSPGVRVKWPNDLWRNGRKITGILLEATARGSIQRVVIGVGINLYWPEQDAPALPVESMPRAAPLHPAGGLLVQPASAAQRLDLLRRCVQALSSLWRMHLRAPSQQPDFSDWPAFDALAGQSVSLYNDQQLLATGKNAGIGVDGAFLLEHNSASGHHEIRRFEIGEVSLRPEAS